jgi:ABC-type uncharacterized transport system substrate-binding protein
LVASLNRPGGNVTGISFKIIIVNATTEPELKEAFAQAVQQRADALLVHVDALFNDHVEQIVGLAAQRALPTMSANPQFPALGGLISTQQAGLSVRALVNRPCRVNRPRRCTCERRANGL